MEEAADAGGMRSGGAAPALFDPNPPAGVDAAQVEPFPLPCRRVPKEAGAAWRQLRRTADAHQVSAACHRVREGNGSTSSVRQQRIGGRVSACRTGVKAKFTTNPRVIFRITLLNRKRNRCSGKALVPASAYLRGNERKIWRGHGQNRACGVCPRCQRAVSRLQRRSDRLEQILSSVARKCSAISHRCNVRQSHHATPSATTGVLADRRNRV